MNEYIIFKEELMINAQIAGTWNYNFEIFNFF